ncbi:hypothetical protein F5Y06DRAFT_302282 [Hypoxylon sp. FL0890]|nr:hypothetical protein F5Y06DRAFT_302282 [Hypoxylon sp. FL0890]
MPRDIAVWYCCNCQNGPMTTSLTPECVFCAGHMRCRNCSRGTLPAENEHSGSASSPVQTTETHASESSGIYITPWDPLVFSSDTSSNPRQQEPNSIPESTPINLTYSEPNYMADNGKDSIIGNVNRTINAGSTMAHHVQTLMENTGYSEAQNSSIKSESGSTSGPPPVPLGDDKFTPNEAVSRSIEDNADGAQYQVPNLALMVSQWLETFKDDPKYKIVAEACETALQSQPTDGGDTAVQGSSTGSNSGTEYQPNKRRQKRKGSAMERDDNAASPMAPSATTESSSTKSQEKSKLACHFWKMNGRLYEACRHNGYGQICHLAEHLRKEHSLKDHSCRRCWRPFDNAEALINHSNDATADACRATEGTPVHQLKISKAHIGDYNKWFWIWKQLFPRFQEPESPYLDYHDYMEQFISGLAQHLSVSLSSTLPAEHLETVIASLRRYGETWVADPSGASGAALLPTLEVTQVIGSEDSRQARDNIEISQSPETQRSQELLSTTQAPPGIGVDHPSLPAGAVVDDSRLIQGPVELSNGDTGPFSELHLLGGELPESQGVNYDIWDSLQDDNSFLAFDSLALNAEEFIDFDELDRTWKTD